jgi:hypothetical protein
LAGEAWPETERHKVSAKARDSNIEYRNPKQIPMTEIPMLQTKNRLPRENQDWAVLKFEHLNFDIVSTFGFRNSDLFTMRNTNHFSLSLISKKHNAAWETFCYVE